MFDTMSKNNNQGIDRRNFLKIFGLGAAATTVALTGCKTKIGTVTQGSPQGEIPTDKMSHHDFPAIVDRPSLLGYGCMRWPMITDPNGGDQEIIDQETVNGLVDFALAHGITYFDTAPMYCRGLSEKATGIALSRHSRDSYYIATKMSNHRLALGGMKGKELLNASVEMYRNSFKSLQTDHIDYYLLHNLGGGSGMDLLMQRFFDNGLLEFLLKEREAGRIRHLGFSFHGDVKVFDYMLSLHNDIKWDFVQIQMNYVDYRHATEGNVRAEYLYGELAQRNIPVVVMEPLLGGRLSNLTDHLNEQLLERYPQQSVASWAFRFAGSFPNVMTVLSGMTYMEHLQDNLRTFSPLNPLNQEEFDLLEETAEELTGFPTVPCTGCKYCMPCPYGIDIPSVFAHYNKCINEGNIVSSAEDNDYRKARRAFLIGYDRSVPKLRQANHCIGCRQCVTDCPQTINIPSELRKIDRYVEKLKRGE